MEACSADLATGPCSFDSPPLGRERTWAAAHLPVGLEGSVSSRLGATGASEVASVAAKVEPAAAQVRIGVGGGERMDEEGIERGCWVGQGRTGSRTTLGPIKG